MKAKTHRSTGSSKSNAAQAVGNSARRKPAIHQVAYVDEAGHAHAIGFDDAGLVNLTQLAAVVKNSPGDILDEDIVYTHFRYRLSERLGHGIPLVVFRIAAPASAQDTWESLQNECWVRHEIASFYLVDIQADDLSFWFEDQRAFRGWRRHPVIDDSYGCLPTEEKQEMAELRATIVALKREVNSLSCRWNGTIPYPRLSMKNAAVNASGFTPRQSTELSNH